MRPPDFRGIYRDDLAARAVYAEGAGIARVLPRAVAVPADAEDVAALVRWARSANTPLVPRGSGSGMAGGAVGPGVIVDLSRLMSIGLIDPEARRVTVGAGVLRGSVEAAARAAGLRFPVNPSSGAFCTVGGMASTNAAGAHTLRYGPMRRWVSALDCVFDDGTRAVIRRGERSPADVPALRRFLRDVAPLARESPADALRHPGVRKESSGYALGDFARSGEMVDLLVGSEGTLALFVGVELELAPVVGATSSLLASFPTLESAVDAARRADESGASACELLDRTFLDVARSGGLSTLAAPVSEAVLLAQIEGVSERAVSDSAAALERAFLAAGASDLRIATGAAAEEELWSLRHAASPTLSRLDPRLKSMQFIEDGAVPPQHLPDYVRGVRSALERRGIRGVIFGHAGDAHVHVNPLIDVSLPDWRERARALLEEVTELVARLGGTLTGEHGDGRLRTPLLAEVWSPLAIELFARTKTSFDPAGVLNPGVKIPVGGEQPIENVKYDPAAAPLPAAARDALDRVERDRAWSRFRLSLLEAPS
jgi:FAD/FMN-containing dehydrogenase